MKLTKWRVAIGIIAVMTLGATAAVADHVFPDTPEGAFYHDAVGGAQLVVAPAPRYLGRQCV